MGVTIQNIQSLDMAEMNHARNRTFHELDKLQWKQLGSFLNLFLLYFPPKLMEIQLLLRDLEGFSSCLASFPFLTFSSAGFV